MTKIENLKTKLKSEILRNTIKKPKLKTKKTTAHKKTEIKYQ